MLGEQYLRVILYKIGMMTYYQSLNIYRYAVRKILDCDHLQSRNNHNQVDIDRGRSHLQE